MAPRDSCSARSDGVRPGALQYRAAIVLAGGRSRRFRGGDKALAELDGTPLLERVVRRTATVVDSVVVSCRAEQLGRLRAAVPDAVAIDFATDPEPDGGPVAGLAASLDELRAEYTTVVACDMPFVEPSVLDRLFDRARGHDGAVPVTSDGRIQPVQAVYRTSALEQATETAGAESRSLRDVVDALDVVHVPVAPADERSFRNVNTRSDLRDARRTTAGATDRDSRPQRGR